MIDHAFFNQNESLKTSFGQLTTKSGTELRRARLYTSGVMYSNIFYKLQLDFSGGDVVLKDAFFGVKNIPIVGNVLIGHVKEPIRLEGQMSSKHITFMERAFAIDFMQERNNGLLISNSTLFKNKATLEMGVFRAADKTANSTEANDGYSITGRFAGKLLEDKNKNQFLHLGLGYSNRKTALKEYKIAARPEAHLSSKKYVSTGLITTVNHVDIFNLEAAFISGPITFQTEYLTSRVFTKNLDRYKFNTYYGQVGYFITGENRSYKRSRFSKLTPNNNFGKGSGAWEIALRYSTINLNSLDIQGGEQTNMTLGVNWYLNPSTRIMLNNVWSTIKDQGKLNTIQMRFQIAF